MNLAAPAFASESPSQWFQELKPDIYALTSVPHAIAVVKKVTKKGPGFLEAAKVGFTDSSFINVVSPNQLASSIISNRLAEHVDETAKPTSKKDWMQFILKNAPVNLVIDRSNKKSSRLSVLEKGLLLNKPSAEGSQKEQKWSSKVAAALGYNGYILAKEGEKVLVAVMGFTPQKEAQALSINKLSSSILTVNKAGKSILGLARLPGQ